jgi:hypothetical protein
MQQLLSIKRIPIEIEVNVQRAELKPVDDSQDKSRKTPYVSVSRRDDATLLRAEPVKVDFPQISDAAQTKKYDLYTPTGGGRSFTLAYQGYAKMDEDGAPQSTSFRPDGGRAPAQDLEIKANKASRSIESVLSALPKAKNHSGVSFSNGKLSIDYSVDDGIDLTEIMRRNFEFIPGKIEVVVTQMPRVEIEYLGGPIYFPRSADPNYEPPAGVSA